MAKVEISSPPTSPYGAGQLQLQNRVQMTSTLTPVTDDLNTTSPLKLSTNLVQVVSTLRITTADNPYIDAEDSAGNNRFTIGRDPSSQVVNVDFASNPTGGTNMVGGIRTYTDGVNLAQVMSFRKDGYIGVGTTTPTENLQVQGNVFSGGGTKLVLTGESFALQTIVPSGAGGMVIGTNANTPSFIDILSANQFFHISNRASSNRLGIYSATFVGTTATYSSELLTLTTGGSLGIGETAPSARVQIKGSGSTSATTSLLVQNSAGTTALQVTDDRTTFVNGLLNVGTIYSGIECNNVYSSIFQNGGSGGSIKLSMGGTTYFNVYQAKDSSSGVISGTINTITTPIGYGWSSGSASPNLLSLNPSINNTGTYSGTFRGIYYNPTLTSLTGTTHIAFENTTGDVLLNTTSGNTLIGSGASNTSKLSIKGSGSTSATASLLVQNSSGTNTFVVSDSGDTTANGSFFLTAPSLSGYLQISFLGNYQQQIRGAYGENIQFGVGGNTMRFNATETYWSYNLYGNAATIQYNGAGCFGSQYLSSASAQLEVISTTKGFLPPRMTDAQVRAIVSPAVGLMAFNTDLDCPVFYSAAGWRKVSHSVM